LGVGGRRLGVGGWGLGVGGWGLGGRVLPEGEGEGEGEGAAVVSGWMMRSPVPLHMTKRPAAPHERRSEKCSVPVTLPIVK